MKSPIEGMLLKAMLSSFTSIVDKETTLYDCTSQRGTVRLDIDHKEVRTAPKELDNSKAIGCDDDSNIRSIYLYREVLVDKYKVDFLLFIDSWRILAIECDGHDFHDRTKQQAAYDRARDRELLRLGVMTIRFTGSEIHHSPERCAREAWACLGALHDAEGHSMAAWKMGWDSGYRRAAGIEETGSTTTAEA